MEITLGVGEYGHAVFAEPRRVVFYRNTPPAEIGQEVVGDEARAAIAASERVLAIEFKDRAACYRLRDQLQRLLDDDDTWGGPEEARPCPASTP